FGSWTFASIGNPCGTTLAVPRKGAHGKEGRERVKGKGCVWRGLAFRARYRFRGRGTQAKEAFATASFPRSAWERTSGRSAARVAGVRHLRPVVGTGRRASRTAFPRGAWERGERGFQRRFFCSHHERHLRCAVSRSSLPAFAAGPKSSPLLRRTNAS